MMMPYSMGKASLLRLLRKAEEELARPPIASAQAPGPCREPMALGSLGPLAMAQGSKNTRRAASPKRRLPEHPQAPSRRRPRKQPHPRQGSEKGDPEFKGVTLKFQMNPDCSLRISPTYSLAGTSLAQKPFPNPARVPEPNHGGNEILEPRRCASCRTQRTPLWRDAEDGTPLCNACGIRYKKYGTRCSSCWLVPRKSVQAKRLCGRCGVSVGSHPGPTQET
ncbi:PREDICTED: GATA-type zinc finger protein 1 [Dipodomys ordii]|uniref:GATA-type zinc finger protein 1 n=1 Tax=Dipodomys ordii TaxID=10020 RepID=A0A1S3GKQ7_DIPOR|nr:PREDICTED: GATA-type zinc finger protein 1 [Dipodomys ordii]